MNHAFALSAALLFAVSVPAGKLLLAYLRPFELAALCYLGSGAGLLVWRLLSGGGYEAPLERNDFPYVWGFVVAGGVLAPLLLFTGLNLTSSASTSMLLNFELVFTSLIAVVIFKEHGGGRFWAAAVLITAGAFALSWEGGRVSFTKGAALVLAAGFCWAVDNNLTARVSIKDPVILGIIKGLAGGVVNGALALYLYQRMPPAGAAAAALALGFVSYGVSLVFFILAMRGLGASRAGAFFCSYPFLGAALSVIVLGDPVTANLVSGCGLMLLAFIFLASERHGHMHLHTAITHAHAHEHEDGHHSHSHTGPHEKNHSHAHAHQPVEHAHAHQPDAHHKHEHA